MKVAIMQPTYLPWCGYLALIDEADTFVLLDDVAFQKQSWQQRNQILNTAGLEWLTVPVKARSLGTTIRDMTISKSKFARKHWRALEHCYGGAPHFQMYSEAMETALKSEEFSLCRLNTTLIQTLCVMLNIETPIVLASDLNVGGTRGEHVASICEKLGADEYLSPVGAADYLRCDVESFLRRNIKISIQHYEHPTYSQSKKKFCSHASVVDLLFHTGPAAGRLLRGGCRESLSLDEVTIQKVYERTGS